MDYGSRWPESWAPPSNAAVYSGAPATHHLSPLQPPPPQQYQHQHQDQQTLSHSSYLSSYYPTISNPSAAAALPGPDPYPKNPYPARGGYEALPGSDPYPKNPYPARGGYEALPGPDPYPKNPYPARGGYEALHPSAAAPPAADPYLPKPYAPRGGYDGLNIAATAHEAAPPVADPYLPKPYAPRGGYDGLNIAATAPAAAPPVADPYASNSYASRGGYEGLHSSAAAAYSYPALGPSAAPSSYYYGGGSTHSLAVKDAIRHYGEDPTSYRQYGEVPNSYGAQTRSSNWQQPTVTSYQRPAFSNKAKHPTSQNVKGMVPKEARGKHLNVTNKAMQSAFCEVCKIDCDTLEVLKSHKQGKKHKKNLLKLQEAITAKPAKAPSITSEKETPAAEEGTGSEMKKKRLLPSTEEEFEIKKKRVLEGGAAADGIKVCNICNVVVNSQKVFEYHIAGQKHAEMLKKKAEAAAAN